MKYTLLYSLLIPDPVRPYRILIVIYVSYSLSFVVSYILLKSHLILLSYPILSFPAVVREKSPAVRPHPKAKRLRGQLPEGAHVCRQSRRIRRLQVTRL